MNGTPWIYQVTPWVTFVMVFGVLFAVSRWGFKAGARWGGRTAEGNARHLGEVIPSTILGMLALILGFTFSMTIARFENRRQLVIDEANAIGTAYLRASLLASPRRAEIAALMRRYVDQRIEYYEASATSPKAREISAQSMALQDGIWSAAIQATKTDRGAIESNFITSLNAMFDVRNERDLMLSKTLPRMIYWIILFISSVGLATFNFVRAERQEAGQWQPTLLVLMISLVFFVILDLDRPTAGLIRISQDAMLNLRESGLRDWR